MRKRVLWGHHVPEYQEMFDLSEENLKSRLLEYGCGPSAVNAELHAMYQNKIKSIDPLFAFPKSELHTAVTTSFDERVQEVLQDPKQFNVTSYGGMDAFLASRRAGMDLFFEDYERGLADGRYQALPAHDLAFDDFAFDFALSSHYLFADTDAASVDFHVKTITELARVAKEVRIFPLLARAGEPSALLGPVLLGLQQAGFGEEVREVRCALYPEGNAMLRVWAQACKV